MEYTVEYKNIYYKLAVLTFTIFIFFEFFGTALPFRPRVEEIEDIGTTNIVNQIVYSILFLASCFTLFKKRKDFLNFILKEKLLTLFILWCFASMIWSVDSFVTFKRLFRTLTLYTVTVSLLLNASSTDEILSYIKPILYLYVFLSIISCLVIPGAIDPQFHTWRGLTSHKNDLGQVSVICILFSFFIYQRESGYAKMYAGLSLFFSVALLFGSFSMTSITSFMFLVVIGSFFSIDSIFKPIGLGRTVSALIILFGASFILSILYFDPSILSVLTGSVGKDITFSGRTDLWTSMFKEISKHPILGAGYQAFWNINNTAVLDLYKVFVWLPNEAHNGYIDILNEVGIVGLVIFISMLIQYFTRMRKLNKPNPWKWIIIVSLVINLQESTYFRPGHLVGGMVVLSYLILFGQLIAQKYHNEEEDELVNEEAEQQIIIEN